MAEHTIAAGKIAKHGVKLVAGEVTTVAYVDNIGAVEIMSDGTAEAYYSVDGSTPAMLGANCYRLPAGIVSVDQRTTTNSQGNTLDVVKFISSGTPTISVQRAD